MNAPANFPVEQQLVVICLLAGAALYSVYWFIYAAKDDVRAGKSVMGFTDYNRFVVFSKYMGFVLMGLLPFVLIYAVSYRYHFTEFIIYATGLNSPHHHQSVLLWTAPAAVLFVALAWLSAGKPAGRTDYPEIRKTVYSVKDVAGYLMAWFFYLLGYEFLFRGLLFWLISGVVGFWVALALNVCVYTLAHIPKGWKETLVSFVLGFYFCASVWFTETIWAAFFVHLFMSWSGNLFALIRNPDMRIGRD